MAIMELFYDMIMWCVKFFGTKFELPGLTTFTFWDVALCVILFYAGGRIIRNGLALDEGGDGE